MDWENLLKTAESAAREAGAILSEGASHLRKVEFQDRHDVKLKADMESEELIRDLLGRDLPYPVYGEEKGGDDSLAGQEEPYWVVDPLDGTYNYLRQSPVCAVSIGLMRGEKPLLGVIYDFNSEDMYSGAVDRGMTVNGQPSQTRWMDKRDQAALLTGLPSGMDRSAERMEAFLQRIAPYKKVRMVGSAAMALAYVAAGIFDVYYEESINLWDVAAGLALVQAAGGHFQIEPDGSGRPMVYNVWAGNPTLLG